MTKSAHKPGRFTRETAIAAQKRAQKAKKTNVQPPVRALRATEMVKASVQGTPVTEIARRFNVSHDTVSRDIQWAIDRGLVGDLERRLFEELGDLAIKALKTVIENPEHKQQTRAALGVAQLLSKARDRDARREAPVEEARVSLAAFAAREQIKTALRAPTAPLGDDSGAEGGGIIDVAATVEATESNDTNE